MEVVSYVHGIVGRNFAMDEVRPKSGAPYQAFVNAIQARYKFQTAGASFEAQQKGMMTPAFEVGEFLLEGTLHTILGLDFNADGLRATAYRTDIADAFILDLSTFAREAFGYRPEAIKKPAVYGSAMVLSLSADELKLFSFMQKFSDSLSEELLANGKSRNVKPFGIRLIVSSQENVGSDAMCVLEKRAGHEAGENIYFSQAPLSTPSHERYLQRIFA